MFTEDKVMGQGVIYDVDPDKEQQVIRAVVEGYVSRLKV